jgi:outer membrane receptor protein involved in Fe transport
MSSTTALVTGAFFLLAAPAFAQEAPVQNVAGDAGDAEEVILVTAQKREERLLDVPMAVTAVSAEALTEQNLVELSDFYNRVPGLQYSSRRVSGLSLRGISTGGNTNPTVGVLVDDVPFGSATNNSQPPIPDFDPGTLERIEVLRGPQGSLYGASSLGGLIKYVTRAPDLNDFTGRLELGANTVDGGNEGWSARGSVNIPIIEDELAVSASGYYRDDSAYIDNILPGFEDENVNRNEVYGGRVAVRAQPTEGLTITLTGMRQEQSSRNSDLSPSYGIPVCPECQGPGNTAVTNFTPLYGDFTTRLRPAFGDAKYELYTGRVDLDLGFAELTSISAWSNVDNLLSNDVTAVFGGIILPAYDAADGSTVSIANGSFTDKFSQEVRLSGVGDRFDWVAGLFYTVENSSLTQSLTLLDPSGAPLVTPYAGAGPGRYREYAGFGALTWHVTDQLDVQVGGRYAKNKQRSSQGLVIDTPVEFAFGSTSLISAESEEDAFTWMVSPSYHITPDLMAYARVATGYRPGGPNTGVPNVDPTFDSDSVVNYELGLKGYIIPRRLSIDVAVFQIDWKDIQLQNTEAVSQLTFLSNGSKARSRGIEATARLVPWRGFTLDAGATWTEAELTEDLPTFVGNTGLSGEAGDRLPYTAKFTANVAARQDFRLSGRLSAFVGANYSYVGDRLSEFTTDAPSATRPRFTLPGYSLVDLQAGIDLDDAWHLGLYVRNLFNERGVVRALNRNGTAAPTAVFLRPRTFGVTLARNF